MLWITLLWIAKWNGDDIEDASSSVYYHTHLKDNLPLHLQSNTKKLKNKFCFPVTLTVNLQVQPSHTKLWDKYIVIGLQHFVKIGNAP